MPSANRDRTGDEIASFHNDGSLVVFPRNGNRRRLGSHAAGSGYTPGKAVSADRPNRVHGQAICILAGRPLTDAEHDAIVADTLVGAPDAKREWTERGMVAEVDARLRAYAGPVRILVGERDMVERLDDVCAVFGEALPNAELNTVAGSGHLLPIEAPYAISAACRSILAESGSR